MMHIQILTLVVAIGCFVTGAPASEVSVPVTVTVNVTYQDGSPAADIPIGAMKAGGNIYRDGQMQNTDANGIVSFQVEVDAQLPYILTFIAGPGMGLGLEGQELLDWMDHAESIMKEYSPSSVLTVTEVLEGVSQYDVGLVLRDAVTVTVPLVDDSGAPVAGGFLIGSASRDMDFNHRSDESPLTIGGIPKNMASDIFVLFDHPPSFRVWSMRLTAQQTQADITLPPVVIEDNTPGDACLQITVIGRENLRILGTSASQGVLTLIDAETSEIFSLPIERQSGILRNPSGDGPACIPSGSYYPVSGLPGKYYYVRLRNALDRGVDVQSFGVPLLEFAPGQNPPIELDMSQIEELVSSWDATTCSKHSWLVCLKAHPQNLTHTTKAMPLRLWAMVKYHN